MLLVLPILNHMNSVHTVTSSFFKHHLNPFPFTCSTVCSCMFPRHSLGAILFSILICFAVGLPFMFQFLQFLWMVVDGRKWYFPVLDWLRKRWRGLGILVNFCGVGSGSYYSDWLYEKWLYFVLNLCYFEICTDINVCCSSHIVLFMPTIPANYLFIAFPPPLFLTPGLGLKFVSWFLENSWANCVLCRLKFLWVALFMCSIFPSGRQPDSMVWRGSRLHIRRATDTSIWHHARQESGHGGRKETEVCDAPSAGCAYRNEKNVFCQLYRDMQDVSSSCKPVAKLENDFDQNSYL